MKKIVSIFMVFVALCFVVGFKKSSRKDTVLIYTSAEEYNMNYLQECLDKAFPEYNVEIEYMSTSNIASKIIEEGGLSEADIVYEMEYAYLDKMIDAGSLANIEGRYDLSLFVDDAIQESNKNYIIPNLRIGGGVVLNNAVLERKGIAKPTSYADLLKPEYKGLLSMPSPKSSGTGYMFYKALVNAWGLNKTLDYFDGFYANICNSFTSSGSGPVNALTNGEAGVGLGMISQAVEKISAGRTDLEIVFFEEGAPYAFYGSAVVAGKQKNKAVMEVFDYIYSDYVKDSCSKFYPESIIKNEVFSVLNFPKNIIYSDMSNNTQEEKERLLKSWRY